MSSKGEYGVETSYFFLSAGKSSGLQKTLMTALFTSVSLHPTTSVVFMMLKILDRTFQLAP